MGALITVLVVWYMIYLLLDIRKLLIEIKAFNVKDSTEK